MIWASTGYTGSTPTISTTSVTNDTTQPTGSSSTGGWVNGNAISTTTGNLKIVINGTFGEGGTISNTMIGLTTFTTAASISNNNMGYGQSNTIATLQFLEADTVRANADNATDTACANGDLLEIKRDGTTLTFYVNEVSIHTATITATDYHVFSTSSDGNTGKHILQSPPSSGGTRLPPPPLIARF